MGKGCGVGERQKSARAGSQTERMNKGAHYDIEIRYVASQDSLSAAAPAADSRSRPIRSQRLPGASSRGG